MDERIYSLETEYAITHIPKDGQPVIASRDVLSTMFKSIEPKLKSPYSKGNLMFLTNGAKFYDDNGHPEWSCPECRSAIDALIWDKAGERMLSRLAQEAELDLGGQILMAKNNVDAKGHFYGCHENYLVERKPDFVQSEQEFMLLLVKYLVPFLVTRQIYTGTGKVGLFQSAREPTFGYQISQRAEAMQRIVSQETRTERAIINTRDEALSNQIQYRRLHLIVGDSSLSEWATFMKLGTTGIVLRLIEDNFIDENLTLENPLVAIREISYDPTCQRPILLKNGEKLTAVEIQHRYLKMAEDYYENSEIDKDTQDILTGWTYVLQKLEQDPEELYDLVDWVSKMVLLKRQMEIYSYQWKDPEVRELDIKYHDIHPQRSLFYQLQQAGAVRTFLDNETIEQAQVYPPDDTRAKIRCDSIRTAQRWGMALEVEWDRVKLNGDSFVLDEPFDFFNAKVDALLANGQTLMFLGSMLEHQNTDVRKRAVKALGQLDGNEAFEILATALLDKDWSVRATAVEVLGSKPNEKVENLIKQALHDRYFIVRCRAAEVLRKLR